MASWSHLRGKDPRPRGVERSYAYVRSEHHQVDGHRLARPALYGVMTFFSSLDPQPYPNSHYEAFSRFVTTYGYVLKHLFLTILGTIFGIFGSIALGAYLARSRAGRMGLVAVVLTVLGYSLFLTWGGISTFATPQEGQAYLAGIEEFHKLPTILANTLQGATMGVSILLGF